MKLAYSYILYRTSEKYLRIIDKVISTFNPSASGARDLRLRQSVTKTSHLNQLLFRQFF